jgi:hypothetical protein
MKHMLVGAHTIQVNGTRTTKAYYKRNVLDRKEKPIEVVICSKRMPIPMTLEIPEVGE